MKLFKLMFSKLTKATRKEKWKTTNVKKKNKQMRINQKVTFPSGKFFFFLIHLFSSDFPELSSCQIEPETRKFSLFRSSKDGRRQKPGGESGGERKRKRGKGILRAKDKFKF